MKCHITSILDNPGHASVWKNTDINSAEMKSNLKKKQDSECEKELLNQFL